MKIISSKPKGQRIFKSNKFKFSSKPNEKSRRPFWIEPVESNIWFDPQKLEWIKDPKSFSGLTTTYYSMSYIGLNDAYSLKAVIRLIHKWKYPKGTQFRASLPFVGYDFFITI